MSVRRFELVEGSASKFWEVEVDGASFTVRYGRIGTSGQAKTKTAASEQAALAEAEKLVREKQKKGYAEVKAGAAPSAPSADAVPSATAAAPKAEKATDKKATTDKTTAKKAAPKTSASKTSAPIPPLELPGDSMGSRALANAAQRFADATTKQEWDEAVRKIKGSGADTVLAHLLAHGALVPSQLVHLQGCLKAMFALAAEPERALPVLCALPDELIAPIATTYMPVVVRLYVRGHDALVAAELPPSLARLAYLERVLAGETLPREQALQALQGLAEHFPRGGLQNVIVVTEEKKAVTVSAEQLLEAFARNLGADWMSELPPSDHVPAAVAGPALADKPLEEVARWLSLFNKDMLELRQDAPARFFEVAAQHTGQKASYLRLAGVRRAESPDDIPAGLEHLVWPVETFREPGFARLGSARLDGWAERWLEQFPNALSITDAKTDDELSAEQVGIGLRRTVLTGLPYGEAMARRLIGLPRAYSHDPSRTDHRAFLGEVSSINAEGAQRVLPVLERLVAEHEDDEKIAMPLRLMACAAIRRWPADAAPDERFDALIDVGDGVDYDTKRIVVDAVKRLPPERAERVVMRSASGLHNPLDELSFAAAGASEAAMRRFARLLVTARYDGMTNERTRGLRALGAAFGPLLAEALANESVDEAFLADLGEVLDPEALAHVRDTVGTRVLDLPAEMARVCAELGGPTTAVYAMQPGAPGTGVARVGGQAAGFAPEEIPRHRKRKLLHAFTVDLNEVPELAQRYAGARALSVWIQAYAPDVDRAQALIPLTQAQLDAHPAAEPAPSLTLTRVEVPVEAYGDEPESLAAHARNLLYRGAGVLLGGPIWLQEGPHGVDPEFIAQYDERLAPGANFGDYGICYSFATRCEWQCH